MAQSISASVGQGGANRPSDVKIVQSLLNGVPAVQAGASPKLVPDGLVGPLTIGAIRKFQQKQFGFADGRVDPGMQTITRLNLLQVPTSTQFVGFTDEQIKTLQGDVERAKRLIADTRDMCMLTPFLRDDDFFVKMLLFNFSIDVKGNPDNPMAQAFQNTMLSMLIGRLNTLQAGMSAPLSFVMEASSGGLDPDAFVLFPDATMHIKPQYFDKGDDERSAVLVHERAHILLNSNGHPGMGGGLAVLVVEPQDDKRPFFTPPGDIFDNAIRNPYNYEWLILAFKQGPRKTQAFACTTCAA